jgi:hypothetical protein
MVDPHTNEMLVQVGYAAVLASLATWAYLRRGAIWQWIILGSGVILYALLI